MDKIIRFEEALAIILNAIQPMPTRHVDIAELAGRVLAEPVTSGLDLPPFDNSSVDGFGVRLADVATAAEDDPVKLLLIDTIRAGDAPKSKLTAGGTIKILTGACVPATVEAVVMREFCVENDGVVEVRRSALAGENVRRRGGEFLRGQKVLAEGIMATPAVVGLVANLGYGSLSVYRQPKAAVIVTGDELTKPGRRLMPGKIYDANSYAMQAALHGTGISDCLVLHAGEDRSATKRAFARAFKYADIVVSTGGVSVGDYDYVKPVLEELGVRTQLWRIAMKPGKPVYFGVFYDKDKRREKYIFGLPGNPVSALVTYHQLVKPAMAKLRGLANFAQRKLLTARLTQDLHKPAGRAEFVRCVLRWESGIVEAMPTLGQDSHMLGGLATADALIHFPLELEHLSAGEEVTVELLQW